MRVRLSTQAIRDLQAIRDRIAADYPARAETFVEELRDAVARIAQMPRAFPLIPRYENRGIRRRSHKGYGVLYSVQPDRIFVHRVIGPGQDHDRALRIS